MKRSFYKYLKGWKSMMSIKPILLSAFAAVFLTGFLLIPPAALATPPQNIQLSYDSKSQTLSVTITHASFFPGLHYIKNVQIRKNGNMAGSYQYDKQPDDKTFAYRYPIASAPGDTLEVQASCNLYGAKTADLIVGR